MFLLLLVFLVDGLTARAIVFAVEGRWDRRLEFFDEVCHVLTKFAATTGRQFYGMRFLRVLEVVENAPIGRHVLALGHPLQEFSNGCMASRTLRAMNEQVVSVPSDTGAEVKGFDRPLLS